MEVHFTPDWEAKFNEVALEAFFDQLRRREDELIASRK